LLSKDVIKESVADVLGTGDEEWSRKVGEAAFEVLYAVARDMPAAVLESHWTAVSRPGLLSLARPMLEVHCTCDDDVLRARLEARASTDRHPIHRDVIRPDVIDEIVGDPEGEPVGVGPLLEVDTTADIELATIVAWVERERSRLD
jgi:hypothetical protein